MALTLAILPGSANNVGPAGQRRSLTAAVTNSGATSVTLQSLTVSSAGGVVALHQPEILTPNQPVGVGNPVIAAGATSNYRFSLVLMSPLALGPSPQSPGGAAGVAAAAVPTNSTIVFTLTSLSSDGTVASTSLQLPSLSTLSPFPPAQGGALQLSNSFNLVNFLTTFA